MPQAVVFKHLSWEPYQALGCSQGLSARRAPPPPPGSPSEGQCWPQGVFLQRAPSLCSLSGFLALGATWSQSKDLVL